MIMFAFWLRIDVALAGPSVLGERLVLDLSRYALALTRFTISLVAFRLGAQCLAHLAARTSTHSFQRCLHAVLPHARSTHTRGEPPKGIGQTPTLQACHVRLLSSPPGLWDTLPAP